MSKVFTITEGLENMGAIRTGGQGSVYKGRRFGEIITAIKLLPTPIFFQDESDKHYRDFSNEVKKLQRVNEVPNPNVVKILSYGVSETGGFPFIEMEYIDGPDLGELLKPPHEPVFPVKEVIKVAEHLSNALAHCHKLDVKHGDIKSNNVKYNKHSGNYVLLDFGLAILSDEDRRTSLRKAGAIEFMAPEQNEGRMFFETDVYSFGVILFELLAGKVPFPLSGTSETARNEVMVAHMESTPPDVLSIRASMLPANWPEAKKAREMQVPDWLIKLIYKCLEKKREDRFRNGMELHEYFSHNRIYTAEVAGLVKNEDDKWQTVVAEKEQELEELKATVTRQDRELALLRQRFSVVRNTKEFPDQKKVSKSAFNAVLIALLLVGGLAVYSLFFNRPVVSAANNNNDIISAEDSIPASTDGDGFVVSENRSAAKKMDQEERKQQVRDSISVLNTTAKEREKDQAAEIKEKATKKEETVVVKKENTKPVQKAEEDQNNEKTVAEEDNAETDKSVQYKVRNKAFFHNEPNAGTKRDAFIVHWNNAVLKPLAEKNGFVYIVFTNHLGQVSKGWLSKSDLIEVK